MIKNLNIIIKCFYHLISKINLAKCSIIIFISDAKYNLKNHDTQFNDYYKYLVKD